MSVLRERIQLNQLAEGLTLLGFCRKHNLNFPSDSVFLPIQILKTCNKDIRDVILLDVSFYYVLLWEIPLHAVLLTNF